MKELIVAGLFGAVVVVIASLWYTRSSRNSSRKIRSCDQIPGWASDPADPKMGDLVTVRATGSLQWYLSQRHEGGRCPVISFWWRDQRVVSVCSKEAFKDTEGLYNRPRSVFGPCSEPLHGTDSIQSVNDAEWEKRKKLLHGTVRGTRLVSFFDEFVKVAKEAEQRWCPGVKIATKDLFHMTLKAILNTSFINIFEDDSELNNIIEAYHVCKLEMDNCLIHPPSTSGSKRKQDFQTNLTVLMGYLEQIIQAHQTRSSDKEIPLLDTLLNSDLPRDVILSDMLTFMAGFHTVGYFATWTLHFLARHPDVQDKICDEIREEVGSDYGKKLKSYTLSSGSYLRQVLDEALRMSSTAGFEAHYSNEDLIVGGYSIPAKTPIIHAIGVALTDKETWGNPDAFDPDRFSPGSTHAKRGLEFRPFGVPNIRRCPANQFTYLMVSVYVAVLLRHFVITPVDEEVPGKRYGIATSPGDNATISVQYRTMS